MNQLLAGAGLPWDLIVGRVKLYRKSHDQIGWYRMGLGEKTASRYESTSPGVRCNLLGAISRVFGLLIWKSPGLQVTQVGRSGRDMLRSQRTT